MAGNKHLKRFIILIPLFLLFLFFFYAGRLLFYNESPQKSDAIIVLSGDEGERVEKAAQLYHQGFAPKLIVSGGIVYHKTTYAQLMMEHALELGVPKEAILLEPHAENTYENALYTKNLMKQHGFTSAIVVSSEYHMRRTKFLFDKVYRGSGITLTYCAAVDPRFDPNRWWSNNKGIMFTLTEYIKWIGYALGKIN